MGDGAPVLLIHGVGANHDDWVIAGIVDDLAGRHRVISVDRPGFGLSPRGAREPLPPEQQAAQLAALLKHLGIRSAVVAGHSFGVLPALSLAIIAPELVAGLVLVGGVFRRGAPVLALSRQFTGALAPNRPVGGFLYRNVGPAVTRATLGVVIKRMFAPQPVPPRYMERFSSRLAARTSQLTASQDDALAIEPALDRILPRAPSITCPVSLIAGRGDALFDPRLHTLAFRRDLPHAKVTVLPAHGHMIHHTARTTVSDTIKEAAATLRTNDRNTP